MIRENACSNRKILAKERDLTERQEAKNANARTTKNQCDLFSQQSIPTKEISKKDWDKWSRIQSHFAHI
tara:strand:- start:237 stop:443 length:207 start_codon:yes stop_codon:yes gene_type:complete